MRAPEFWRQDGLAAGLLAPAGWLYDRIGALRRRVVTARDAGVPVLCVGNAVVGGAGKTPVALTLADRLRARGKRVATIAKGYGGGFAGRGAHQIDPQRHDAADAGDEALLHAARGPTYVARRPDRAAALAVADGAEILVMDDGFQNPFLRKTVSVLVFDGAYGIGNGRVLPAGPLRETLAGAVARSAAAVVIGRDATGLGARLGSLPVLAATAVHPNADTFRGARVYAFSGIGRPEKFFRSLDDAGAIVRGRRRFPDHHRFAAPEIADLLATARALDALPVTTEKDWVRLPAETKERVAVLDLAVRFDDDGALDALLSRLF